MLHELESAIQWVENHQNSTFLIMRNCSTLLPERGFIENLLRRKWESPAYVQFDSSREAAYLFEKYVKFYHIIRSTKLQTIDTEKLGDAM